MAMYLKNIVLLVTVMLILTTVNVDKCKAISTAASLVLANVDSSIDPCDNFYKFSCGNFIKKTIIPDDKTYVDVTTNLVDKLQEQLRSSIEAESNPNEPRPFKLMKTFYKSCMDAALIEEQGLDPLKQILNDMGGWPVLMKDSWIEEDFSSKDTVYKFRQMGFSIDYLFTLSVSPDLKDSTKNVISLDQPLLGLPREHLVKGMDDTIVSAYYDYMIDIAVMLGADRAEAKNQLEESLNFEIQLAKISLPSEKRRNFTALYNPMTVVQLSETFSMIPWTEYFNVLLTPSDKIQDDELITVHEPSFIQGYEKLLKQTSKRVQANYLMWRAVQSSVSFLNEKIRERQLAFSTLHSGITEFEPRWKECIGILSSSLFMIGVDAMYVRTHFNEDAKQTAKEMVSNIRSEFTKTLKKVDWMDDKTRQAALDKAESMTSLIGYPNELLNDNKLGGFYEKLEITPGNYFKSRLNLTIFEIDYMFHILRTPVNEDNWISHSATVNAYYSFQKNRIIFPAGILQDQFFDKDRPQYMNYGAIGWIMGHEITHGFDDEGSQIDKDGNVIDWWEPETKKKYLDKAECIIEQYGNYTESVVGLKVNGVNTLGENIGDNGGIKIAYQAYKEWVKRNGEEEHLRGVKYNNQQMFWISAANDWCVAFRPKAMKEHILTGIHSPNEFRVIGSFSNMPEFAEDFNCPEGSKMNPKNRCAVW